MPWPAKLTDEQRAEAFAYYQANRGKWGVKSKLARRYGISAQSMGWNLDREAARQNFQASRGTRQSIDELLAELRL